MTTSSVGFGVESTYGTAVTPTVWVEHINESLDYSKGVVQGKGLSTSTLPRSSRRVITKVGGAGKVELEVVSKGLGKLWRAALGVGASTLVSGTTYQQNFTLSPNTMPSSLTVQKGVYDPISATVNPYTFKGCLVDAWEIKCGAGEIATASFTLDARDMATGIAYTSPSYITGPSLFHFAQGAIVIGGTVTAPTATALASGGTAVTNIIDFAIQGDNNLSKDRHSFGGAGLKNAPAYGARKVAGKVTVENTDNVLRDAVLADTPLALVLTFTSGEALSTGVAQFQIVCSEVKFDGSMPEAGAEMPTMSLDFEVLDNQTATQPLYIIHRTADTAI